MKEFDGIPWVDINFTSSRGLCAARFVAMNISEPLNPSTPLAWVPQDVASQIEFMNNASIALVGVCFRCPFARIVKLTLLLSFVGMVVGSIDLSW